jgi:(1->4)-alpha-D-glucan 1-alpha-D-glucosylmutase
LSFLLDWQQLTGAVMAKGFEDTTLYVYNRLLSLNEVGGEPAGLGPPGDVAAFHHRMEGRLRRWPAALSASSTHDSKRSEDVQARIDVVSEMPREWWRAVLRWEGLTADLKGSREGQPIPDPNETLYLYQTLLGSWPLDPDDLASYPDRIAEHMVKALREAKTHSSWYDPDEAYETTVTDFARALIAAPEGAPFREDFAHLQDPVAWYGALGSLSRLLIKCVVPGVPDTYQGCELWQLTLVDPDNRRPVGFALRRSLLEALQERQADPSLLPELLSSWRDGRVKLWLTWRCLDCRRRDPELYHRGSYIPLEVDGPRRDHLVAFARRLGERWVAAVAPRWLNPFTQLETPPLGTVWQETAIRLPRGAPVIWRDALAPGQPEIEAVNGELPAADALARFPAGLLVGSAGSQADLS